MSDGDRAFEERVRALARAMDYPPTPNIAGRLTGQGERARARRLAPRTLLWAASAVLVGVILLLAAAPAARATVGELLRVGVVRILLGRPANWPFPAETRAASPMPGLESSPTAVQLLSLAGETSLGRAREEFPAPVRLPSYPPDLGDPDRVFLQEGPGASLALVWLDPNGQVRLALFELSAEAAVTKLEPQVVATASVGGQDALWTAGPYLVETEAAGFEVRRLVEGHVLIWEQGSITFRLETDQGLAEAVRIAESLE